MLDGSTILLSFLAAKGKTETSKSREVCEIKEVDKNCGSFLEPFCGSHKGNVECSK